MSQDSKNTSSPSRSTRRNFLKKTSGTAVTAGVMPYFAWANPSFANDEKNDRPNVGCIGLGSMGTGDARNHKHFANIVALCDVDSRHAEQANADEKIGEGKCDVYKDYRKILDRNDIDVVSIVTPDHWHVKIAVEALESGKHVFCQKPVTLTLEENKLIRAACKKHKDKIFFVGTQQRSSKNLFLRAVNMVRKGLLGDIKKIKVGINGGPKAGPFPVKEPPQELDWNMWLGQAPKVDYREKRCHYQFRWWYEYSGGKFTDWGAHHVDIASWAIGMDKDGMGPVEIDGTDANHPVEFKDGFPVRDDTFNTSHDYSVICKFENGIEMDVTSRGDNGILFEGSKGRIFVNRQKIVGKPIEENWDEGKFSQQDLVNFYKGKAFEGHKKNFYRCIREGGLPVSDVFTHVQAMSTCHLAAIAARLGRVIKWDPKSETIIDDEQAASFMKRERREGFGIPNVAEPVGAES